MRRGDDAERNHNLFVDPTSMDKEEPLTFNISGTPEERTGLIADWISVFTGPEAEANVASLADMMDKLRLTDAEMEPFRNDYDYYTEGLIEPDKETELLNAQIAKVFEVLSLSISPTNKVLYKLEGQDSSSEEMTESHESRTD